MRPKIRYRYKNIFDLLYNPTFHQPIGARRILLANRWMHFWNLINHKQRQHKHHCVICGSPIKKDRQKHKVCYKHRMTYLAKVKRGEIKPVLFAEVQRI